MSSRERLLTAMAHREPGHVPFFLKWWLRPFLRGPHEPFRDQFHRVEENLKLGLDDAVTYEVPRPRDERVRARVGKRSVPGERYPVLFKEYETPKGPLTQVVRQTGDWKHGDDIPLFDDQVVPRNRSRKYLVETMEDVERLRCLFREPTSKELEAFHRHVEQVRRFAERHGTLIVVGESDGLYVADALPWLCGFENTMIATVNRPSFVEALLDVVAEWDERYLRLVLEAGGADVIVHRGWYECANFWSIGAYKTFLKPRIRRVVEVAHKAKVRVCYIMSTGIMPLLETIKELGVDVLYGVDPVQGGADLRRIKKTIGDQVCLWGGVNSAVTLGYRSRDEIERAVGDAITTLGPRGGFILSAIDQVFDHTPWRNIEYMIAAWCRMRRYPLPLEVL